VDRLQAGKIFIGSLVVCVLVTIYSALAIAGVTGQTRSSTGTTLGFITIATTVGMYGSPMATIVRVVRTKTAASMPFTMGVVTVLNSACWIFYSALESNMFILAPNIAGFTLGSVQLSLTFIYPSTAPKDAQILEADDLRDEPALSVVVLSPLQDEQERKLSSVDGRKSPSFAAMCSPSRGDTSSWRQTRNSSRPQ
jgi:solute carrier family 50 protein (sugar transporter)